MTGDDGVKRHIKAAHPESVEYRIPCGGPRADASFNTDGIPSEIL
jgi:hypothetical protein